MLHVIKKVVYLQRKTTKKRSYMETKNAKTLKNNELQELSKLGYVVRPIRDLKLGEIFQLKVDGSLFVRDHYVPSSKKYCVSKYDDAMACRYLSGDKLVIVY